MRPEIEVALDECLEEMRRGCDMHQYLNRYPEYAAELRPLLETVVRVGRVLTPPAMEEARAAGRERMLAALAERRRSGARHGLWQRLFDKLTFPRPAGPAPAWRLAALTLVLLLVGGIAVGASSADSLPGGALYPLKKAARQAQLALTLDPTQRESLEEAIAQQERQEIAAALHAGRRVRVEFGGTVEAMEGQQWTVGGLPLTLDPAAEVQGPAQVGVRVRVQARLPGDGGLLALRVDVEAPARPTPVPTQTATPSATPSRTPSATPSHTPSATATPSVTPSHTASPTPTDTNIPTATSTLAPTSTPAIGATPPAADTAEPEDTVGPGSPHPSRWTLAPPGPPTGEPEETEEAHETEEPDETPQPTETPKPTEPPDDDD